METTEGNVRVTSVPRVTISDTPLRDLIAQNKGYLIEREVLALVKKVQEQRDMITKLNKIISGQEKSDDV